MTPILHTNDIFRAYYASRFLKQRQDLPLPRPKGTIMNAWLYEIIKIEQTDPPAAEEKGSWFRYTIANNITEITGRRRGSRDEVMNFVKVSLQRLNNRHKTASFSKS